MKPSRLDFDDISEHTNEMNEMVTANKINSSRDDQIERGHMFFDLPNHSRSGVPKNPKIHELNYDSGNIRSSIKLLMGNIHSKNVKSSPKSTYDIEIPPVGLT